MRRFFTGMGGILWATEVMGLVVYLDAFVGLNFLVDLCLLLGVNRLAGHPPGFPRAAAAAALGGGYAGACLLPGFAFLANGFWRMVSLGLMCWTAFGLDRSGWSRCMLFVLLSMALGGLAMSLDRGSGGVMVSAGALACLSKMGLRGRGREYVPVSLTYGGKTLRIMALKDTGNSLRDPFTGEIVTVLCPDVGTRLGIRPEKTWLIPAKTVGGGGLLTAVRCDRVEIGGKPAGTLVAFARENFGNGEYHGLTGGYYG